MSSENATNAAPVDGIVITPSEQPCPKCGSDDIHREYRESGEEWKTHGVSKQRTSKHVKIGRWSGSAKRDCIVHHCRCCQFDWDTDALA
jgi:hypothetical protein